MVDLLEIDGQPVGSTTTALVKASTENALDWMARQGIVRTEDGGLNIGPNVLKRIRAERMRRAAITSVPSTPRHLTRDGGGIGISKGHGRFEVFSLSALRKIRERAPILQAIHQARNHQVRRLSRRWPGKPGEVGWRVVHKDHREHDADPPEYIRPFINKFEEMLKRPSDRYCKTTAQLLSQLEEDLLTINRPVVELIYSMFDRKRVVGFRAVDGELIWPTLLWIEKWQADNPRWYGHYDPQILRHVDVLDLASAAIGWDLHGVEYCLVREGILEAVYPRNKLLVAPIANRTEIDYAGYPPSTVEMAMDIILTFINTWDFNSTYFTRGMLAEFILGISGNVHDDDIQAFVDMFREATQGVRHAHQPPIMPLPHDGVITKIDLKPTNREMMFEIWLSLVIALCTAVYRMDPSTINAKPWDGGSSPALSEPNREKEIALAKEEGLQGDIQHLTENILTPLARTCHPDLELLWEYGDFDPRKEAEIHEINSRVSWTRNEIRLVQGKKPMGFWVPDKKFETLSDEDKAKFELNLWNMPSDPGFVNAKQMEAQAAAQEELPEPGGMPPGEELPGAKPEAGPYGEPPGEETGGGPDEFGQPAREFPYGQPPGQPLQKAERRITVYVEEA